MLSYIGSNNVHAIVLQVEYEVLFLQACVWPHPDRQCGNGKETINDWQPGDSDGHNGQNIDAWQSGELAWIWSHQDR